jgi:hypothetical protein
MVKIMPFYAPMKSRLVEGCEELLDAVLKAPISQGF